ncbi:UDP-glucose 4-epimerase GalE [Sporosarcina sp. SAFN-015]|uniref:UDP-glucose 4-epimerase GalE n=1 Tax=Sporosarcina sp. SAFN-015 TaxID=3387274 RepID=UPI003F7F64EA
MSILVTGGTGYIGSHTIVELLEAGFDVIVVDNLSNSSEDVIDRIEKITGKDLSFYNIDLLNKKALDLIFHENSIEAVIHFAGYKAVGESVQLPLKYYQNNIISTLNMCEVMEKYGVYNLIFSSSATVYGYPERLPLDETCSTSALNPYGRTKLMIEEILTDLSNSNRKWRIALLRYFNPVGAHNSGLIGEKPNGTPNNLMPYITQVASGKLEKLYVFGGDYPSKDGTGVRDYIHVVDLALGHLKALKKIDILSGIEAFNLGTGIGYSVLEVIETFEEASKVKIPYEIVSRRFGDTGICYANPVKANKHLNWYAERDLFEMCKSAWDWENTREFISI